MVAAEAAEVSMKASFDCLLADMLEYHFHVLVFLNLQGRGRLQEVRDADL